MRKKLLGSMLAAALSAVVTFVALGGASGAKSDVQANTSWPSVAVSTTTDGAGS